MTAKVLYVERRQTEFVSLEKAFREIASALGPKYLTAFEKLPYGVRVTDALRNLLSYRPSPADIFHVTGHVNYIAMLFPPERTVLSIMDVRFVNDNKGLRRWLLKKLYLDLPVRRLKYVTAISENVRREIIALTGCPPSKVRTFDLPLFGHFSRPSFKPFDAENPTILQVGTMKNKNIENLARALRGLRCRLVIVGILEKQQRRALNENGIDLENLVCVTDDEMREVYDRADIVTFCSTYEGFGLPIIEGQAAGKPVITSDLSPMRETAGGGALLVDPNSPLEIRSAVERIINDDDLRNSLMEIGRKNVERFSPEIVARQYESLYEEILRNLD